MELNRSHKDLNIDKEFSDFLKSHKPDFKKSEKSEWEQLNAAISKGKVIPFYAKATFKYAAIAVILLSFSLFSRYYSNSTYCPKGEHLSINLPDNSKVVINADTKVSYHPIWWYISREVKLEGEAYFEVKKGKKFSVISTNGKTTVLGTSFNIFSRRNYYNVSCRTGKVKIESAGRKHLITKGQAINTDLGKGKTEKLVIDAQQISSWKNKKLNFTAKPLSFVFKELERQYNIKIDFHDGKSKSFTGSLSLNDNIEKNLDIVCKTLLLEYNKKKTNKYDIKEK